MTRDPYTIDWGDLVARPQMAYQLAICLRCGNTMIRRTPDSLTVGEATYHRHLAAATAGLNPLTHCPKCQAPLYQANLPN